MYRRADSKMDKDFMIAEHLIFMQGVKEQYDKIIGDI
jgi:hypothetical protein